MKTLKIVFLGMICTSILAGCSKEEWPVDEQSNAALKAASVTETIISVGLPNDVNDTEAFLAAFANAAGKLNPVVQLEEGVYHLDFVEIREFCGTFRGKGIGVSIITTIANLEDNPIIAMNRKVVLVKFVGGDVCMRDMTFMTSPGPISPGVSKLNGIVHFCSRNPQYTAKNSYIHAVVDRVEISGYPENTTSGIKVESDYQNTVPGGVPLSHVDIQVTNCLLNGVSDYGVLIQFLKEGKIDIGTKGRGNVFSNIKWAGLGLWSNVNVKVLVQGNTFFNPKSAKYGIDLNTTPRLALLEPVPQTTVTVYNIEHNDFNITGGASKVYEAVIYTEDLRRVTYPEEAPALVQAKNNKFNLIDNPYSVFRTFNMSGMVIRNNQFSGNGQYGVMVRSSKPLVYSENGLILGNNLSNSTFSVASVWLETLTKNWTIVGGNLGETVKDDTNGAGGHLITGMNVNTSEEPLGQRISDNLEEMREGEK